MKPHSWRCVWGPHCTTLNQPIWQRQGETRPKSLHQPLTRWPENQSNHATHIAAVGRTISLRCGGLSRHNLVTEPPPNMERPDSLTEQEMEDADEAEERGLAALNQMHEELQEKRRRIEVLER